MQAPPPAPIARTSILLRASSSVQPRPLHVQAIECVSRHLFLQSRSSRVFQDHDRARQGQFEVVLHLQKSQKDFATCDLRLLTLGRSPSLCESKHLLLDASPVLAEYQRARVILDNISR